MVTTVKPPMHMSESYNKEALRSHGIILFHRIFPDAWLSARVILTSKSANSFIRFYCRVATRSYNVGSTHRMVSYS